MLAIVELGIVEARPVVGNGLRLPHSDGQLSAFGLQFNLHGIALIGSLHVECHISLCHVIGIGIRRIGEGGCLVENGHEGNLLRFLVGLDIEACIEFLRAARMCRPRIPLTAEAVEAVQTGADEAAAGETAEQTASQEPAAETEESGPEDPKAEPQQAENETE